MSIGIYGLTMQYRILEWSEHQCKSYNFLNVTVPLSDGLHIGWVSVYVKYYFYTNVVSKWTSAQL